MKTGLIITVSMLQPSPQSSSRYPSERRGLGEKKEKKEGKEKRVQFWLKLLAKQGLTRDMCLSSMNLPKEQSGRDNYTFNIPIPLIQRVKS